MRALMKSDFLWRFVGGFALGAIALVGVQPEAVKANLHIARAEPVQVG